MPRLPIPGGDSGIWGSILNEYLSQVHKPDGTLKDSVVTASVLAPNAVNAQNLITTAGGTNGHVLTLDSAAPGGFKWAPTSSAAVQQQVDWNATSGVTAIANKPSIPVLNDATSTAKGIVQLGGDLGGTAANPLVPALATKANIGDISSCADYVITKQGATITATPRPGSGLTSYSGANASVVIQSAIDNLTQTSIPSDGGGGKIYIAHGKYFLANELVINGWIPSYVNPLSQLVIQGDGLATQLIQNTAGQNGIVIKNGARFSLTDLRIFTGINAKSSLLLDSSGTDTEWSCNRSFINNVHLDSNSTTQPAAIFRNFFDLSVPLLEVQSNSKSALVLENASSTANYGNSHFGFLRSTCATPTSPNAGLTITTTTGSNFMNLLTFDNYECVNAYYGIYTVGAKFCRWNFVDIEMVARAVYFDGTAAGYGFESRHNEIAGGYLFATGSSVAITQALCTGGNSVKATIHGSPTVTPVVDSSRFRPANRYDLFVDKDAASLISMASSSNELTLTYTDGTIYNKKRSTTKTSSSILALVDACTVVEINSASASTVTVPSHAAVPFPLGTCIEIVRLGTGAVTIVADTGVTLNSIGSLSSIAGQYGTVVLRKRATNEWVLTGNLS